MWLGSSADVFYYLDFNLDIIPTEQLFLKYS